MDSLETEALFGEEHDIKLTHSESVEVLSEPDSTCEVIFHEYVKVSRSWDKAALKKALKKIKKEEPDHDILKHVNLQKNKSIKFYSHKES